MQLQKLLLNNFRQHKKLELDFPESGVITITGNNAAGKSTIVMAINFALTGKTPGNQKDANISWGEDSGSVQLQFKTDDGVTYVVTRNLHDSKCAIAGDDGTDINTISKTNAKLSEVINVDPGLLAEFCFVHQGSTTKLVDATYSERFKLFQTLLGLDRLSKVDKVLQTEITNSEGTANLDVETIVQEIALAKQEKEQANNELQRTLSRLNELAPYKLKPIDLLRKEYYRDVEVHSKYHDATEGFNASTKNFQSVKSKLDEVKIEEIESRYSAFELEVKTHQDKLAGMASDKSNYDRIVAQNKEHERLRSDLETLSTQREALHASRPEDPGFAPFEDEEEARVITDNLAADIKALRHKVESLESGVCPTCGTHAVVDKDGNSTPMNDLLDQTRVELETKLQQSETLVPLYKEMRDKQNTYVQAIETHNRKVGEISFKIKTLNTRLDEVPLLKVPDVGNYDEIKAKYDEAVLNCNKAKSELNQAQAVFTQLTMQLNTFQNRLDYFAANPVKTTEELQEAKTKLDELDTALIEHANLSSRETELKARRQRFQDKIENYEKKKADKVKFIEYIRILRKARELLQRQNLPLALTTKYQGAIQTSWNDFLDMLSVDFTVELTNELDIMLDFDGKKALVSQLSGGQRCALALSFLLSVNKLFASDLGLLFLDEPTYGLDREHIELVSDLLNHIHSYAEKSDMQVFIVTHEDSIKNIFTQNNIHVTKSGIAT